MPEKMQKLQEDVWGFKKGIFFNKDHHVHKEYMFKN
jgi:hypothetical protein